MGRGKPEEELCTGRTENSYLRQGIREQYKDSCLFAILMEKRSGQLPGHLTELQGKKVSEEKLPGRPCAEFRCSSVVSSTSLHLTGGKVN